jgi:methionyl-tRNA formyltransferase
MRTVFMGTPKIGASVLEALDQKHNVVMVVTQPDKIAGRGNKIQMSPVKELALAKGMAIFQPDKIRLPQNVEIMQAIKADVIVVAAYGQILPKSILEAPKHGCVNIHTSLLPKLRGAAPANWAIINGDKEAGVTIMQMDAGIDTGDILLVKKTEITSQDTAGTLLDRLAEIGAQAVLEALEMIEVGTVQRVPQDHSQYSYAPMVSKETGRIDWKKTSTQIANLVRGLNPAPGAFATCKGEALKIWEAEPAESDLGFGREPGDVIGSTKRGLLVKTGEGALLLTKVQAAGAKAMPAADYFRGHPMPEGSAFS